MGEPDKAFDWMIQAAGGIGIDPFLTRHLFSSEEVQDSISDGENPDLTVMYYLKIIALFEQFGYYENVIELAKTAIGKIRYQLDITKNHPLGGAPQLFIACQYLAHSL